MRLSIPKSVVQLAYIFLLVINYTFGQSQIVLDKAEEERISDLLGISPGTLSKLPRLVDYFDKINVDRHLQNKDFVQAQIKCLIYDGPCGIFGRRARVLLPAVILDNCRLCTSDQKNKLSRVVVHLQQNYPGAWRDALVKYGGAPKFITAGHVAPQTSLFGPVSSQNSQYSKPHHHVLTSPIAQTYVPIVQVSPSTASTLMIPIMLYSPSSPPEPVSAVESPNTTFDYKPTLSPRGGQPITSSSEPPSTPVVESTLDFKPTTLQSDLVP